MTTKNNQRPCDRARSRRLRRRSRRLRRVGYRARPTAALGRMVSTVRQPTRHIRLPGRGPSDVPPLPKAMIRFAELIDLGKTSESLLTPEGLAERRRQTWRAFFDGIDASPGFDISSVAAALLFDFGHWFRFVAFPAPEAQGGLTRQQAEETRRLCRGWLTRLQGQCRDADALIRGRLIRATTLLDGPVRAEELALAWLEQHPSSVPAAIAHACIVTAGHPVYHHDRTQELLHGGLAKIHESEDRARLLFALAESLQAVGRHEEAVRAHFRACNEQSEDAVTSWLDQGQVRTIRIPNGALGTRLFRELTAQAG